MEAEQAGDRRLVVVTPGNLKNSHIYVPTNGDFFPPECFGASRRGNNGNGYLIEVELAGLARLVRTDIPTDARTGKPKGFLREREWIGKFFKHHRITAGDTLTFERTGLRQYRLSPGSSEANGRIVGTAAEFFSGIGLIRLALERQHWQVLFANDIDEDKAKMYRHNWPEDAHLAVRDIHDLKADDIPPCDLFTASFPCNDLSIAGRWEGLSGKESSAFWGFVDILKKMRERRPRLVLLENVVGFLMSHGGADFEEALLALNRLGYVVDAMILNAVHWVPQSRARLFVIARLDDGSERQVSASTSEARPDALTKFATLHPHIRWDFQALPSLPKPVAKLTDILDDLPENDPHWWSDERAKYFIGQLSQKHLQIARERNRRKSYTYATAFRRVRKGRSMAEIRTDGIAGCLRTPRGGSGRQILLKAGRGRYRVRLLTARECARLQGVPDGYVINVPLNKALFGFGDAVCVPAVEWIVQQYLTPIARELSAQTPAS